LIGHAPEFERTNFSSLRSRSKWADANEILDGECLLLAYASPVDRATAMIGDFMVTLYGGSEGHVREHVSRCLAVTAAIAERVTVGMEFRDLYGEAMELMEAAGVRNDTQSTTDRTGALNIGHTVPWSDGQHDDRIWSAIRDGEETDIANLISGARTFITGAERTRVSPNVAFTVEPQLVSAGCPQVTFHVIVCICNGEKHVHAGFLRLFEKFDMVDYLPPNVVRQVGG